MLVPKITVITEPKAYELAVGRYTVYLTATPYSRQMDIIGYGYSPEVDTLPNTVNIHMAHGMLLDHKPPFDRVRNRLPFPACPIRRLGQVPCPDHSWTLLQDLFEPVPSLAKVLFGQ